MQPWPIVKIGDVTEIVNGGTPKSKVAEYWDGDVLWITPKDMGKLTSTYVHDTSRKITRAGLSKSSAKLIPANSVILSTRAPIGHLVINRAPMATNQGCRGLIPSARLDAKFLFYFLGFNVPLLNDLGSGTTFKELAKSALAGVEIPLPPLPEQKLIAAILDEAFEGIGRAVANAEKNLANARELFESYLNAVFEQKGEGSRQTSLDDLCESGRIITYGVIKLGDHIEDGIPCLRTSNVRWLRIETKGMKYIGETLSNEYRRTILRGGEVLVNVRGTLGGVAVASPRMEGWNVSREVAVVPSDRNRVSSEFLAYWIGTKRSQSWLTSVLKGVAYTGINIADLRTLPVPLPDLAEQTDMVEKLDRVLRESRRLEETAQEKLATLTELKQSILEKAFAGELTNQPDRVLAAVGA